ncbi:hypothetical protein D3C79_855290 [compost metagenome]
MPQVHHRTGHRLALLIQHAPLKKHHRARINPIVHPHFAFGHRCTRHIQRPFDGPRGATADTGFGILSIQLQVQVVFNTKPCHQQACFLATAQTVQVIHCLPELIRGDLQVLDDARAAQVVVKAADFFEEFLDIGSVSNFHGHDGLPRIVVIGTLCSAVVAVD